MYFLGKGILTYLKFIAPLSYQLSTVDLGTWRRGPRRLGDGPFAATLARWAAETQPDLQAPTAS